MISSSLFKVFAPIAIVINFSTTFSGESVNINLFENKNIQNSKLQIDREVNKEAKTDSSTLENVYNYVQENFLSKNNYKSTVVISSAIGIYSLWLYVINNFKNYLEDSNLWSCWKGELSIEKFIEIPQEKMAKMIFEEISSKYENKENFAFSITQFIKEIENEKNKLILYSKIYNFIKKYYLIKLIPLDTRPFEIINEKIERLAYIKNILLSSSEMSCLTDETQLFKKKI